MLEFYSLCGRSVIWLSRLPVTEETAGSNPVGRAKFNTRRGVLTLLREETELLQFRPDLKAGACPELVEGRRGGIASTYERSELVTRDNSGRPRN